MKTLNNINLTDAFRFAANISGRLTSDLTLGDVADTFNNISTMVNELIMSSAPQSATSAFTASPATPAKLRGRPLGVKNAAPTPAKAANFKFNFFANAFNSSASATVTVNAFSVTTCLPANKARLVYS